MTTLATTSGFRAVTKEKQNGLSRKEEREWIELRMGVMFKGWDGKVERCPCGVSARSTTHIIEDCPVTTPVAKEFGLYSVRDVGRKPEACAVLIRKIKEKEGLGGDLAREDGLTDQEADGV